MQTLPSTFSSVSDLVALFRGPRFGVGEDSSLSALRRATQELFGTVQGLLSQGALDGKSASTAAMRMDKGVGLTKPTIANGKAGGLTSSGDKISKICVTSSSSAVMRTGDGVGKTGALTLPGDKFGAPSEAVASTTSMGLLKPTTANEKTGSLNVSLTWDDVRAETNRLILESDKMRLGGACTHGSDRWDGKTHPPQCKDCGKTRKGSLVNAPWGLEMANQILLCLGKSEIKASTREKLEFQVDRVDEVLKGVDTTLNRIKKLIPAREDKSKSKKQHLEMRKRMDGESIDKVKMQSGMNIAELKKSNAIIATEEEQAHKLYLRVEALGTKVVFSFSMYDLLHKRDYAWVKKAIAGMMFESTACRIEFDGFKLNSSSFEQKFQDTASWREAFLDHGSDCKIYSLQHLRVEPTSSYVECWEILETVEADEYGSFLCILKNAHEDPRKLVMRNIQKIPPLFLDSIQYRLHLTQLELESSGNVALDKDTADILNTLSNLSVLNLAAMPRKKYPRNSYIDGEFLEMLHLPSLIEIDFSYRLLFDPTSVYRSMKNTAGLATFFDRHRANLNVVRLNSVIPQDVVSLDTITGNALDALQNMLFERGPFDNLGRLQVFEFSGNVLKQGNLVECMLGKMFTSNVVELSNIRTLSEIVNDGDDNEAVAGLGLSLSRVFTMSSTTMNVCSLDLSGCRFRDEGLVGLANGFAQLQKLQKLNVSHVNANTTGLVALFDAISQARLGLSPKFSLSASDNDPNALSTDAAKRALMKLKAVCSELSVVGYGDALNFDMFDSPELERLELTSRPMVYADVEALFLRRCPKLKLIYVRICGDMDQDVLRQNEKGGPVQIEFNSFNGVCFEGFDATRVYM